MAGITLTNNPLTSAIGNVPSPAATNLLRTLYIEVVKSVLQGKNFPVEVILIPKNRNSLTVSSKDPAKVI